MLRRIFEFYRTHQLMVAVEKQVRRMFGIAGELYTASGQALLEGKQPPFDLFERDREINLLVVDCRKKIVSHLSISNSENIGGELVLLKVCTDLERVGDYCKNIHELSGLLPKPLPAGAYRDTLVALFPIIQGFFSRAELALFDGSEDDALEVIESHKRISRECEQILTDLMQDERTYAHAAIGLALSARYFKRISSHLKNVASTAVNPFPHIGYKGSYPGGEDQEAE